MTYFEKLGNTISAKSREFARKAKTVSETSSLNNVIRAEQHKIEMNYKMMGKLYFKKFSDSPNEEFLESIDAIKISQQKITETQEQITKIKNRTCCPNCGTTFKIDAAYCSKCGTKVMQETPEPEDDKCTNCGNILEEDAVFCDSCGTKVGEETPLLKAVIETVSEQSEDEVVDNNSENVQEEPKINIIESEKIQKVCPKCGEEADDISAKFCNQCGAAI